MVSTTKLNSLIHRNIWKMKSIKTFKKMIHYNKCPSMFNVYLMEAKITVLVMLDE